MHRRNRQNPPRLLKISFLREYSACGDDAARQAVVELYLEETIKQNDVHCLGALVNLYSDDKPKRDLWLLRLTKTMCDRRKPVLLAMLAHIAHKKPMKVNPAINQQIQTIKLQAIGRSLYRRRSH